MKSQDEAGLGPAWSAALSSTSSVRPGGTAAPLFQLCA